MKVLNLPHQEPIHFAKYILWKNETSALVKVKFKSIPSLGMLIEAAAQSSAAFNENNHNLAFLVSVKDVKLLCQLAITEYDIKINFEYRLENIVYFYFEVIDANVQVANGTLTIALQ